MTPQAFSFRLTVPTDPDGATVVAAVAAHAVQYSGADAAAGAAFVERVRAAATQALQSASGHNCLAVIAAKDGQLTVTMGGQSVSVPLPA
jgi:hypothetical protein